MSLLSPAVAFATLRRGGHYPIPRLISVGANAVLLDPNTLDMIELTYLEGRICRSQCDLEPSVCELEKRAADCCG